ncbi:MAG: hypothetical protein GEU94_11305 [Micromonosporaceae bacterium]|nr:hypothetical protein [Micromonosporaceae bacterium]
MSATTAVILLSFLGAAICVRSRAAAPAVFFAVFAAVVLFTATSAGEQLNEFFSDIAEAARQARTDGAR